MTSPLSDSALMQRSAEARLSAYAPYSHFFVGAALLCEDGTVFTGCNIENAAFTPTNCAERTAFFTAVCAGKRHFTAIAIVGGKEDCTPDELGICAPCGVCRQVMAEFCDGNFRVLLGTPEHFTARRLSDLLPLAFTPRNLAP